MFCSSVLECTKLCCFSLQHFGPKRSFAGKHFVCVQDEYVCLKNVSWVHEQSTNHISFKNRPRCTCRCCTVSPTAQDAYMYTFLKADYWMWIASKCNILLSLLPISPAKYPEFAWDKNGADNTIPVHRRSLSHTVATESSLIPGSHDECLRTRLHWEIMNSSDKQCEFHWRYWLLLRLNILTVAQEW